MIITDDETTDPESANVDLLRAFGPPMAEGKARCFHCWLPVTMTPAITLFGQGISDSERSKPTIVYLHPQCATQLATTVRAQAAQVLGDTRRGFKPVTWQRIRDLNRQAAWWKTWHSWLEEVTTPEEMDVLKQHVQREYVALAKLRALDPTA